VTYALFDSVILAVDLPDECLKTGTRGAIVEILENPALGYAVEFFDADGNTIDWTIVSIDQILPDSKSAPLSNARMERQ
jgi:hypothetical protein